MAKIFERYRYGEYGQVWNELSVLGRQIRQEPLFPDAWAVAQETMRRTKENIESLVSRLKALGYNFRHPSRIFIQPSPEDLKHIAELESLVEVLPLSLRLWYEVVGTVDLMGEHPEFSSHVFETPEGVNEFYPDPMVVDPVTYAVWSYHSKFGQHKLQEDETFEVPIAPEELLKEDISGAGEYAILVPNAAIDAPLLGEWHHTTFVNYLRICFRWGGFPVFERYPEHERPTEMLNYLTKDLLPI